MKKLQITSIGLSLALAITMSGCGTSGTKPQPTKSKTKVAVWTNSRSDMDIRKAQVDAYNKENSDNIEIEYEVKADNFSELIKIAYQANNAPDIHTNLPDSLMKGAVDSKWLRPLDKDFIDEINKDYMVGTVKPYAGDHKFYVIGVGVSLKKFIYNKDLFKESGLDPEKAPTTWDEVRNYAKIITQKGGGKKYGFAIPLKEAGLTPYYATIPSAPSGKYNFGGFDVNTGKYDFNIYKDMINILVGMKKDGSTFPTPATLDNDTARAQFSEGNIGMMTAASWDIGVFNDQFPAKCNWAVVDFPTFDGKLAPNGGYPVTIGGTPAFSMNNNSKNKDAQLKIMKWLINEKNLKELSLAGKAAYTLKSVNKPEFMNKDKKGVTGLSIPSAPMLYETAPNGTPDAFIKLEGDGYTTVMRNIITGDNKDVKKELQALTDKYNAALDKYVSEGGNVEQFVVKGYDPTKYDKFLTEKLK